MNQKQRQLNRLLNEIVSSEDVRQDVWISVLSGDTRPILTVIRELQLRHDFIYEYQDLIDTIISDQVSAGLVRFLYLLPVSDKYLFMQVLMSYAYSINSNNL